MSSVSFNNFGYVASKEVDNTILASRYGHQKNQEKMIVLDVIEKLELNPLDQVLDIGSGPGLLTLPLSYIARTVTAVDHEQVLKKINKQQDNNIILKAGNFLELDLSEKFNKIVTYSVLHYLQSENEVLEFVKKAISLLHKDGILMIGDVANRQKQDRYFSTEKGLLEEGEFNQNRLETSENNQPDSIGDYLHERVKDDQCAYIDDDLVVKIFLLARNNGCDSYIVPQKQGLPFSNYREDILIYS